MAENILLKTQREAEEKKLPYMANLLANVAFDISISGQMAHQIVKAAEALTYRQICLLALFSGLLPFPLRKTDYRSKNEFPTELMQILYECYDLAIRGFVSTGGTPAFGPSDINPSVARVQGLGAHMFNLMGLAQIPITELDPLVTQLRD